MALGAASSAVLTGTVVTVGRWAEGKQLSMRVVVGATFLAIGLAVLGEVNENLGNAMAALVLVAAVMRYALPIISKTGVAKQ